MDNTEEECLRAMCSAKAFQQEMKLQSQAFVGILESRQIRGRRGQSGEDTSSKVQKIKQGRLA